MKNLVIEAVESSTMVRIKYEGGGEAPDELKGMWTTPAIAKKAIDVWLSKHPDRDLSVKVKSEDAERTSRK